MKKLLFLLIINFSIINNISLVINNTNYDSQNVSINNFYQKKAQYTIYFNSDKTSQTISQSYGVKTQNFYWIATASFSNKIPTDFSAVNIFGKDDCYTKTSWGSSAYYGTEVWKKVNGRKFVDLATNVRILDGKMAKQYANIELLNIKQYYMSAGIIAKQFVGFSWYYDNKVHKFYFQMFAYFYSGIWGSLIGGCQWLNIGIGIDFI